MVLKLSTGLNGLINIILVKGIKSRQILRKNRGHQKSPFFATCKNSENLEKMLKFSKTTSLSTLGSYLIKNELQS